MGNRKRNLAIVGTLIGVGLIIAGIFVYTNKCDDKDSCDLDPPNPTIPPPPSATPMKGFARAAISCDAEGCAEIARDILEKENGNVADAAIAALLCMGVKHSQSMGIGGGFLAVYYDYATKKSTVINARETAPAAATKDMFNGNAESAQVGGLAVAVPGEMKGYWEMYKKFGSFDRTTGPSWSRILQPTIEMCEQGFTVDHHMAKALVSERSNILKDSSMREILVNPDTNDIYHLGDVVRMTKLAETLKIIAANQTHGGDLLYLADSQLAQWFVQDLKNDFKGIMTMDDLVNYKVDYPDPVQIPIFGNYTRHAVPPPGSGAIMGFILRLLSTYQLTPESIKTDKQAIQTYQLIIEAFKNAYAKRTILGDPRDSHVAKQVNELTHNLTTSEEFLNQVRQRVKPDSTSNDWKYYGADFYMPDDHGTAHLSIVDQHGNAIAVTSTVNLYFGAKIRSKRTGIIYNDEMDDFSAPNITNYFGVPPSPNNFIAPGKRPLSSMTPAIFTNPDGSVKLAVGTAGGTKITTATSYVSIRNLWFGETIKEAIDARRIHHQLFPMELSYEMGFLNQWVDGLKKIGHKTHRFNVGTSVVCGVSRDDNGTLFANADFRKDGSIAGF